MNVFNEVAGIRKAIDSVYDYVDRIVVADGAYAQFPHEFPQSTDGTLKILEEYEKVEVIRNPKHWNDQCEKRSSMFVGNEGDYYIKLDGDEYIANPKLLDDIEWDFDVAYSYTISPLYRNPYMVARIFKHREGLHYAGRHHWLYDGSKRFIASDQGFSPRLNVVDVPLRFFNLRNGRDKKRRDDKNRFLHIRNPQEGKFKSELEVYDRFNQIEFHPMRAKRPDMRIRTIKEGSSKPQYSYLLMFSRKWAMRRYFEAFDKLKIPSNTELLVVLDTNDTRFEYMLERYIRESRHYQRFVQIKIHVTGNERLPEMSEVRKRRKRIIENWHCFLAEAQGDIFLVSEDDSLPEPMAYAKLLRIKKELGADLVQANIIGRWGANLCPAWRVKEKDGVPDEVYTLAEKRSGADEIQGCGWYCFVADADVVRKYPMIIDDLLPLGPDVRWGYELHKNGYRLFHSWDVKVTHFGQDFELVPGRDKTGVFKWERVDGKWRIKK